MKPTDRCWKWKRSNQHGGYQASKQETERGRRGRPPFDISKEQLSYFIDNGFKIKNISSMLGVSVRTVERRSISGKKWLKFYTSILYKLL